MVAWCVGGREREGEFRMQGRGRGVCGGGGGKRWEERGCGEERERESEIL